MSFKPGPKPQALVQPSPVADPTQPTTERQRRLETGGTRSTFLGSLAQGALPSAGGTLTGLNTGR